MSKITTNTGRTIFKDAETMMLVPYTYDGIIGDYVLGSTVYDISAIIGDSTVIEQSEGTTETKENEFVNSPLIQSVSGGKYNFTAQCLDLQNNVLKSVFSAMTAIGYGGAVEGAAAFNDDNVMQYALIRLTFKDSLPDIILPKVQMNNRLFVQQLHTRAGQGNISGIGCSTNVAIDDKDNPQHLLQFLIPSTGLMTFTPYTPMLFVPHGYKPMFLHHKDEDPSKPNVYSMISFLTGSVSLVAVNAASGTWTNVV